MSGQRFRIPAALVCLVLLASGCGSQLSDDELLVGAGGSTVTQTGTEGTATGAVEPGVQQPGTVDTGTAGALPQPGATTGTGAKPNAAGNGGQVAPGTDGSGTKGGDPQAPAGGGGAVTPGKQIVIGQVGEFSGIAGQALSPGRIGMEVWAKWVNARGGVEGHPIKLLVRDSGGDASRSAALAKELVEQDGAVAIVGAMLALSFDGLKSYTTPKGVPVVGGDGVNAAWFGTPNVFPSGTTQSTLNLGYITEAVKLGKPKVGLFYCVELPACSQNNKELQEGGAQSQGGQLVYSTQISVTTLNFQPQCTNAKNAGVEALYVIGDAGMVTRMARDCRQIGFNGQLMAPGIAINSSMGKDPNLEGLLTMAFNSPWVDDSIPAMKSYQDAVRTYAPTADVNGATVQGWVSGFLFAEAIAKIPANSDITSQSLTKALYGLSGTTISGMAPKMVFKEGQGAEKNRCYFIARVVNHTWTAPQGSKTSCIK